MFSNTFLNILIYEDKSKTEIYELKKNQYLPRT